MQNEPAAVATPLAKVHASLAIHIEGFRILKIVRMTANLFCILLLAFSLMACSSNSDKGRIEISEFISIEDQALQDINDTPTSFVVPFDESTAALARIDMFFSQLATRFPANLAKDVHYTKSAGKVTGESTHYNYVIQSSSQALGMAIKVSVSAKINSQANLADRNARNLARFIKDGMLEVSLIDP